MYKVYDEMIAELRDAFKAELASGIKCLQGDDAGKLVDMIKDLEEAKRNCYEACYYRIVSKAMTEEGEGDDHEGEYADLMGYNPYRNSHGEYSTRGGRARGKRGYRPGVDLMGRVHDPNRNWEREMMEREMRMGYDDGSRGGRGGNMGYSDPNGDVAETIDALSDMYDQADPETQKRIKEHMMNLLKEKR